MLGLLKNFISLILMCYIPVKCAGKVIFSEIQNLLISSSHWSQVHEIIKGSSG